MRKRKEIEGRGSAMPDSTNPPLDSSARGMRGRSTMETWQKARTTQKTERGHE
jgi:hypothetical protein